MKTILSITMLVILTYIAIRINIVVYSLATSHPEKVVAYGASHQKDYVRARLSPTKT